MSLFDCTNADCIAGYTRAIQDVTEIIDDAYMEMNYHHLRLTRPLMKKLLHTILENRALLRERRDGFIRWNVVEKHWEYYTPKRGNER